VTTDSRRALAPPAPGMTSEIAKLTNVTH